MLPSLDDLTANFNTFFLKVSFLQIGVIFALKQLQFNKSLKKKQLIQLAVICHNLTTDSYLNFLFCFKLSFKAVLLHDVTLTPVCHLTGSTYQIFIHLYGLFKHRPNHSFVALGCG